MMKRYAMIAALATGFMGLASYLYKHYFDKPDVMMPVPGFDQLCEEQGLDSVRIADMEYPSSQSSDTVTLGDVWERHIDLGKWNTTSRELFDLSVSGFIIEARHSSGVSRRQFGFVDQLKGDRVTLKFRLRAELVGTWDFAITDPDGSVVERGLFEVIAGERVYPSQLTVDPSHKGKLLSAGKPFHWIGGKWISAQNYAPCYISQMRFLRGSHQPVSDQQLISYLDYLLETKHNSLLVKMALFPLLSDGYSWDLDWIGRADWLLREALSRGLYVQINLFDTWSRDSRYKVLNNTSADRQVFNVWNPDQDDLSKIKSYLRTLIARYSAYPNIVWELGNEMEHRPNCGECFVEQANQKYLPWIREADPYGHLVGLSEGIWLEADVDLGFLHQTRTEDFENIPADSRPMVMNELVFSDDTDALWKDSSIRDRDARFAFRRTFWRNLMNGTTGSFEATWLNISRQLDDEVKAVMHDHAVLSQFVAYLGQDLNKRTVHQGKLDVAPGVLGYSFDLASTRFVYLMLESFPGDAVSLESELLVREENVRFRWMNVTTGEWSSWHNTSSELPTVFELNSAEPDLLLEIGGQAVAPLH